MDLVVHFTVPGTGKAGSPLGRHRVTVDTARGEVLISRFPSFLRKQTYPFRYFTEVRVTPRFDRTSAPVGFVITLYSESREESVALGMETLWEPAHTVAHALAETLRIPVKGLAVDPDEPIQPHSTVRVPDDSVDLSTVTSEQLAAQWLYNILGAAALAGLPECHVIVGAAEARMFVPMRGILRSAIVFRDDGTCSIGEYPELPPYSRVTMIRTPVAGAFAETLKEAFGMDPGVSDRPQNGAVRVELPDKSCDIHVISAPMAKAEYFLLCLRHGDAEIDPTLEVGNETS